MTGMAGLAQDRPVLQVGHLAAGRSSRKTYRKLVTAKILAYSVFARLYTTPGCASVVGKVNTMEAANQSTEAEGDESWHGKEYGYKKKGCRGPMCREWWNATMRRYRADRMARTGEAFSGRGGGFVPGKPCACGCGETLPATSSILYKRGHNNR